MDNDWPTPEHAESSSRTLLMHVMVHHGGPELRPERLHRIHLRNAIIDWCAAFVMPYQRQQTCPVAAPQLKGRPSFDGPLMTCAAPKPSTAACDRRVAEGQHLAWTIERRIASSLNMIRSLAGC